MINIENVQVVGWEPAIRGMRNPKNSWDRMDSVYCEEDCPMVMNGHFNPVKCTNGAIDFCMGENDHDLAMRLAKGGPVHAKYRRMIVVYLDITAPLYWWKEFDTYKVGTVANSCSTMHKIHAKEFTLDDFSVEHLNEDVIKNPFNEIIACLNFFRGLYLQHKDKDDWWQMIQLLPTSYNQKRTVMLNYEVLVNMYESRRGHKLDEWRDFCEWIETLPYSEIITGKKENK